MKPGGFVAEQTSGDRASIQLKSSTIDVDCEVGQNSQKSVIAVVPIFLYTQGVPNIPGVVLSRVEQNGVSEVGGAERRELQRILVHQGHAHVKQLGAHRVQGQRHKPQGTQGAHCPQGAPHLTVSSHYQSMIYNLKYLLISQIRFFS